MLKWTRQLDKNYSAMEVAKSESYEFELYDVSSKETAFVVECSLIEGETVLHTTAPQQTIAKAKRMAQEWFDKRIAKELKHTSKRSR